MKKPWIKPALIVVGTCIALVGTARILLGLVVGSAEFRDTTARVLERGLGQLITGAMVEVDSIQLSGFSQLHIANLLIRSGQKADVTMIAPTVHVSTRLWTLIRSGLLVADLDITLVENGRIKTQVAAPFKWILGGRSKSERLEPYLAMEGTIEGVSVPPIFALVMAGENRPGIQLTAGRLTGRYSIRKPVGVTRATGHKSGRIEMQILSPRWTFMAPDGPRDLNTANMEVSLELQDFALGLRQPLVFQDRKERAVVTGALLLPKYAEEDLAWDLIVKTEGSTHLALGLSRLLRCGKVPSKTTFTVKGRISSPRCGG